MDLPIEYEYQTKHVAKIDQILQSNVTAVDTSPTGSGKTYAVNQLAKKRQLDLLIIAPLSVHNKHAEVAAKYDNTVIPWCQDTPIIGPLSLIGKNDQVKHPFLIRRDRTFYPTFKLFRKIQQGILLVVDECQDFKNPKILSFLALRTLARSIYRYNRENPSGRSRMVVMSATPNEQSQFMVSLVTLLCLTRHVNLYELPVRVGDPIILTGMNELIHQVNAISEKKYYVAPIVRDVQRVLYQIYVNVLKDRYSAEMIKPDNHVKKHVYNALFQPRSNDLSNLEQAGQDLQRLLGFDENLHRTLQVKMTEVLKAVRTIHGAKARIVRDYILERADRCPNEKYVIVGKFVDIIQWLQIELMSLGSVSYYGATSKQDRQKILKLFQANNLNCRVMIVQEKAGSIGIDLDDKFGQFPRVMLVLPSYSFINLTQALGRCYRIDTQSDFHAYFIYCNNLVNEWKIYRNLLQKKEVLTSILHNPDDEIISSMPPRPIEDLP